MSSAEDEINPEKSIINVTLKKKPPTLLISAPIPLYDLSKLPRHRYKLIILNKIPPDRNEILKDVQGVDGILWVGRWILDAEIMEAAGKQLKIISVAATELSHIDMKKAKELNIVVRYLNKMPADSKADIAIGLMIAVARRYRRARNDIERYNCDIDNSPLGAMGLDIRGATVGLIGFSSFAPVLCRRLKGFDVNNLLCSDPNNELGSYKLPKTSLDSLVQKSDFIFMCCTLTEKTKNIINEAAFNKMKPNCVLINVLRSDLIDQEALYEALLKEKIFGAGLDTFNPEPIPKDIIMPHISWSTFKSSEIYTSIAMNNILKEL